MLLKMFASVCLIPLFLIVSVVSPGWRCSLQFSVVLLVELTVKPGQVASLSESRLIIILIIIMCRFVDHLAGVFCCLSVVVGAELRFCFVVVLRRVRWSL